MEIINNNADDVSESQFLSDSLKKGMAGYADLKNEELKSASYVLDRKVSKSVKLERLMKENNKLKMQILQMETMVSSLDSRAMEKENKLQLVMKSQKNIEKMLAKKVAELREILMESGKYKENAFNRIVHLEEKCNELTLKLVEQTEETSSLKAKYNKLKRTASKEKIVQVSQSIQHPEYTEMKNDKLNKATQVNQPMGVDKSTNKIEMVTKSVQVVDDFLDNCEDNVISDLFFIPPSAPPAPPLPDLDLFNEYSWFRNIYEQTQVNEESQNQVIF